MTSRPRSEALFKRASQVIPGGVNSPVRAFKSVGGNPLFIASAKGSSLTDADGNTFIDYVGSWGPLLFGHAPDFVVEAVREAALLGTSYGAPTEREIEMAELVCSLVPSIEMVRFVSSGSEATSAAIRLARGATGRSKIVKCAGCFHGSVDSLLVMAGSGVATLGIPETAGVPDTVAAETIVVEYNDIESLTAVFDQHGSNIAGFIVEPIAGNMGLVPPADGYLQAAREITRRHGALLIFDEVISGFRAGAGGAQELFGIMPDLTCLGKIIGGGLPVGAYGGSRAIMENIAPLGQVYQAGTLSGNPLAMAAGIAMLTRIRELGPALYARLDGLGRKMEEGLSKIIVDTGTVATVRRMGSLFTLFFGEAPLENYTDVKKCDTAKFARVFTAMLNEGVYLAPSQFECNFNSFAHTESDIERTLDAFAAVLRQ